MCAEQSNNCTKPLEIIKHGMLCMTATDTGPQFEICDSSNTLQKWVILKTEGDRNDIRICRRPYPGIPGVICLTSIPEKHEKQDEYFSIWMGSYSQSDISYSQSVTASITHQMSSVQYPKFCVTSCNFSNPTKVGNIQLNVYGDEFSNSKLRNGISFNLMPALDKNGEQLCYD